MRYLPSIITLLLPAFASVHAAEPVKVGAGSYSDGYPEGFETRGENVPPPTQVFKTDDVKLPVPTNDWWSTLVFDKYSNNMFPHPLAVRFQEQGIRIYYPGLEIRASKNNAIAGMSRDGDLTIGHSASASFPDARASGWSDWFVSAQLGTKEQGVNISIGHGSPFVYAQYTGGEPVVTFAKTPTVFSGTEKDAVLGLRIDNRVYGLFAPSGSTWSGIGSNRFEAKTGGKGYFSVAVLPDEKPETLAAFRAVAYNHVVDTKVAWVYDEKKGMVESTYTFETKAMEGSGQGTIFALYPHQWRVATAQFTGQTYSSIRGPMKIASGAGFKTALPLPAALVSMPVTASADKEKLKQFISSETRQMPATKRDTYWLGKSIGKIATILPIAEQLGDQAAVDACDKYLRTAIEGFLTAEAGERTNIFVYEKNWGTLIGYPASYGSSKDLNDHHFHYGYFIRAAGEIARRDPAWASDEKWGGMLKLVLRDFASGDRNDKLFPFMRNFDIYAGHTWASGNARFVDGNNNESSSEAINAWYGTMLLGEATGNKEMRDLGAWCFATEISAIEDYWFDVRDELFPKEFGVVLGMVWGSKIDHATWFSGEPEMIHGINFLPITAGSLHLGRWPEYVKRNVESMAADRIARDAGQRNNTTKYEDPSKANWKAWADIIWMFQATYDADAALKAFEAKPGHKPEDGNTMTTAYTWITAFKELGQVDRTVYADAPFTATFNKAGKKTHIAWNLGKQPRTVTFSDGAKLDVPAGKMVVK